MSAPSYDEINARLCERGQPFELETREIRGVPTRTWKQAPGLLRDILVRSGDAFDGRDLFRLESERLTHDEHRAKVASLAVSMLDELGVRKGDRVAIAMRNYPEWSIAFWAATAIGAVATPLNAFWNGAELAFGVRDSGATVVVVDGERLERLAPHVGEFDGVHLIGTRLDDRKGDDGLPATRDLDTLTSRATTLPEIAIEPDDPATIFYTSGTTGLPKGVLGTHRNICSNLVALSFTRARQAIRDDVKRAAPSSPPVSLMAVPLFHATGCHSVLVSAVAFGATIVFMRRWDPEVALDLMEEHGVTTLSGVPAMVWDILNSPSLAKHDLSTVRSVGAGGAAAPPELLRRLQASLPDRGASVGYGLTETSSITTFVGGRDYDERPGSVGVPIPVCELRFVDGDGHNVPAGDPGEIWIKGPNVVPGYWNRPDETAATFTDGWLHSGDIGRVDEDGFVYIVDRAKDIIIRGGENVSSLEVEAALYQHADVLEVAVFAVPHQTLGEEVGAAVRLREQGAVSADDLRQHAAALLAPFKVPTRIWLVNDPFPRNPAGKLLKRELQARLVEAARSV